MIHTAKPNSDRAQLALVRGSLRWSIASMLSCLRVMYPFLWIIRPEKSVHSGKIESLSPSLMGIFRRFMRRQS